MPRKRKHPTAARRVMTKSAQWRFIVPFMGPGLHLYATISKGCYEAYIAQFPEKRTSVIYLCSDAALLEWAVKGRNGYKLSSKTCAIAAGAGNLVTLKWARSLKCPINYSTCDAAAANGHLNIVQWMHEETVGRYWRTRMGGLAARNGHLELLKWVLATLGKKGLDASVSSGAAAGGHQHILEWAQANELPWDAFTCDACARTGNLTMLKWARERNCPWKFTTFAAAAGAGQMELLQWLIANGCRYNEKACAAASGAGHLHVLQWLRRTNLGVPWTQKTCTAAARNNHLHTLQWAVANGCRWHVEKLMKFSVSKSDCHMFTQAIVQGQSRFGLQYLNTVHSFFDPMTHASNTGQLDQYVQALIAWQRAGLFGAFMDLMPNLRELGPDLLVIAPGTFVAGVITAVDRGLPPGEEAAAVITVTLRDATIAAEAAAAAAHA